MMDDKFYSKSQYKEKEHNIILEKRKRLNVTGVTEVDSFDETSICLYTEYGVLDIRGENLHINKLSVETGEVMIEGDINSLTYGTETEKGGGFLSKLFK